jgi:SAM-dependent methyltransferase
MNVTPARTIFDEAYAQGRAPWDIGEPQPAVVELARAGHFRGRILDVGCGTGEHTLLLARLGYRVLGVDASSPAIARAKAKAKALDVDAHFEVGDALKLDGGPYDTVLDSALFHIFDDGDRGTYVASLHQVMRPGGRLHILALSDEGPGFGPEVDETTIREAFGAGWRLAALERSQFIGVVTMEEQVEKVGLPLGQRVHLPGWLATVRRL